MMATIGYVTDGTNEFFNKTIGEQTLPDSLVDELLKIVSAVFMGRPFCSFTMVRKESDEVLR